MQYWYFSFTLRYIFYSKRRMILLWALFAFCTCTTSLYADEPHSSSPSQWIEQSTSAPMRPQLSQESARLLLQLRARPELRILSEEQQALFVASVLDKTPEELHQDIHSILLLNEMQIYQGSMPAIPQRYAQESRTYISQALSLMKKEKLQEMLLTLRLYDMQRIVTWALAIEQNPLPTKILSLAQTLDIEQYTCIRPVIARSLQRVCAHIAATFSSQSLEKQKEALGVWAAYLPMLVTSMKKAVFDAHPAVSIPLVDAFKSLLYATDTLLPSVKTACVDILAECFTRAGNRTFHNNGALALMQTIYPVIVHFYKDFMEHKAFCSWHRLQSIRIMDKIKYATIFQKKISIQDTFIPIDTLLAETYARTISPGTPKIFTTVPFAQLPSTYKIKFIHLWNNLFVSMAKTQKEKEELFKNMAEFFQFQYPSFAQSERLDPQKHISLKATDQQLADFFSKTLHIQYRTSFENTFLCSTAMTPGVALMFFQKKQAGPSDRAATCIIINPRLAQTAPHPQHMSLDMIFAHETIHTNTSAHGILFSDDLREGLTQYFTLQFHMNRGNEPLPLDPHLVAHYGNVYAYGVALAQKYNDPLTSGYLPQVKTVGSLIKAFGQEAFQDAVFKGEYYGIVFPIIIAYLYHHDPSGIGTLSNDAIGELLENYLASTITIQ